MPTPEKSRVCPECAEKITGRSDKKFCSDACRSAFNNRRQCTSNALIRSINRILQKNRNIMLSLSKEAGKTIVKKDQLLTKGFNFLYYTHTYTSKNGHKYYFCYDHAYLALKEEDKYLLVKQQS